MKRILLFAVLILICFLGCTGRQEPQTTDTTISEQAAQIAPTAPDRYANPFSKVIPSSDVIVTNLCFGQDIWPDYSYYPSIILRVLSKHPLDYRDCSVTMPIRTQYTVSAREVPVIARPQSIMEDGSGAFPYYLYEIYRGTDWKTLANMIGDGSEPVSPEKTEQIQALQNQYLSDFNRLTTNELPSFYTYEIEISFPDSYSGNTIYDESCGSIGLHLGDFETELEGRSFEIHGAPLPLEPYRPDGSCVGCKQLIMNNGTVIYPYSKGIASVDEVMGLEILEDLTLTGFTFHESRFEILKLSVAISSESGNAMDFLWDGVSPIRLHAGDQVMLSAVVRDLAWTENTYEYAARLYPILRYECGEEKGTSFGEYYVTYYPDPWETYAVWFDGLDISGYYKNYYQPIFEPWRAEFTEAQP